MDLFTNTNNNGYKRKLTYTDLLLASLGHILGAGIYSVIGKLGNTASYYSYLSIIIASLFVMWIAKGYVDINEKYESNDSEFLSIKERFGPEMANTLIYGLIIGNIFSCVVIAISFGGYLSRFIGTNVNVGVLMCIIICGIVSIVGIKETAQFNNIMTIVETSGLIFIVVFGFIYMLYSMINGKKNIGSYGILKSGDFYKHIIGIFNYKTLIGIAIGAYLILFAFFGFESLVKFSEESINPSEDIPDAINHSLGISTIIYVLVSLTSLNVLTPKQLGNSIAPLTDVLNKITSNLGNVGIYKYISEYSVKYLGLAAVSSTFNTFLIILTGTIRLFVSIINKYKSNDPKIQKIYNMISKIDKTTGTPINSTILFLLIICILVLSNIDFTSSVVISTFGLLITMVFVKLSTVI